MRLRAGGRPVEVTTGRLRALIAVLALSAGRTVTVQQLVAALWSDALPANPRRSVQTYVTRLRTLLGADLIETSATGYVLHADEAAVDVLRFERLLERADGNADPLRQRACLAEALELWRGRPFDDVDSEWLSGTEAPRLEERHLAARERRITLDLDLGRPADLVPELRELTAAHPLREPSWALLLGALERSGRRAEALVQYERVRARLVTELGTDPGPQLQAVYARLLAEPPPQTRTSARPVPRQLPADVPDFVGRADALALLDHAATTAPVATVSGTAGVGKTTLAVHWAHRVADRFPDGQLYVNLRGFDPDRPPVDPTDAIRGFLDALRVPHELIPADADGQAALYRSMLAGRRVLVLLDNARDARQARPLLPGSADCLTLVTSRDQLIGLTATAGARAVTLDLPPAADARELVTRRIGGDRVAAEPDTVDELVTLCARLPLALAVAAARVAGQPESLEYLVAQLRAASGGLEAFAADDATIDLRSVFSWSYDGLSGPAARLFRLVGSTPGPDIGAPAAAALADQDADTVRSLLGELTRAHLLTEHTPGRWSAHDLLRAYARELAGPGSRPALGRLLDHYLATALLASGFLRSDRETFEPQPPPSAAPDVAEPLRGADAARAWFAAERRTLLAAVDAAADRGYPVHAWQLAWAHTIDLDWRGRWRDIARVNGSALLAVRELDDTEAEAHLHRLLGRAHGYLDRHDDARAHLERALELYAARGDLVGQARTQRSLGVVKERTGRHEESLDHDLAALELFRRIGQPAGLAGALNAVGWAHAMLGRYQRTLEFAGQALTALQGLDDRLAEAATWDTLGFAHHRLGAYDRAVDCFEHALDLLRELGGLYYEVVTLRKLADSHEAAGDDTAARRARDLADAGLAELGELPATAPGGPAARPERQPARPGSR
nr:BTAD domain-containing putative transcriptional regulator [Jiangella mangrovi]